MTEKYTPEKVAELVAEARRLPGMFLKVQLSETQYLEDDALAELDAVGYVAVRVARSLADALESAAAERDRLHKAITEALDHDPLHGRSEGLHCGGMSPCIRGILRAALDKEGRDS